MKYRFVLVLILGTLVNLMQSLLLEIPNTAAQLTGSKTITLYTNKRTWKEAQQICRNNGGNLINLETAEKREQFRQLKLGDLSSGYDRPWVGLYWTNDQTLHWDGSTCPAPVAQDVDSYEYKADGERNFKDAERCYRENNGLELRGCGGTNQFVCESFAADGCPYEKRNIPIELGSEVYVGLPTLDTCRTECNNNNGCFLSGNVFTRCILMYAVDYSNNSVVVKNCASDSTIVTSAISGITADNTDPDGCLIDPTTTTPAPAPACPDQTITETSTETSTETTTETTTETSTSMFTEYSTETSTDTYTETSTEFMTETSTETNTETSTETVTETSTITNGATTVYEVSSITISDVSTAVITVTESPSCDVTCSSSEILESSLELSPSSTVYMPHSTSLSSSAGESDSGTISSTFGGFLASDGTLRTQVCRNIIYVTHDPAQTQAAVNSIVNELTVEKGNLTAVVIKKISAEDERPSSTVIGYAGIVFLVIPLILMIVVDVPTYYLAAQSAVKFCKNNHK